MEAALVDVSRLLATAAVDGRGLVVAIGEEVLEDKTVIVFWDPADEELIEAEEFSTAKPASAIREGKADDRPPADTEGAGEGDPLSDVTGGLVNVTKVVEAVAAAVCEAKLDKGVPAAGTLMVGMLIT